MEWFEEEGTLAVRQVVVESGERVRLDRWLSDRFSDISRVRWQKAIRKEEVTVDGEAVNPREMIAAGRVVGIAESVFQGELVGGVVLEPERLPLEILWEDEDLLILNKAPGMVVHPGNGCESGTVLNAALFHCGKLPDLGDSSRPGIIHRLDKETSGVLILAKTEGAGMEMLRQFRERHVRKTYVAVVQGVPPSACGTCEGRIGRHPIRRTRMAVTKDGRPAVSHWEVLGSSRSDNWALLRVRIETGRTHQIRVHLAHEGFPVLGDSLYGYRKNRSGGLAAGASRVLLHAMEICLRHPRSGIELKMRAPIPPDLLPFSESQG